MSFVSFDAGTTAVVARDDPISNTCGLFFRRDQEDNNTGSGVVVNNSGYRQGTSQAATTTTVTLSADSEGWATDYYVGWWIKFTGGPAINQVRRITSFNMTTKVVTVSSAFTVSPGVAIYRLYFESYVGIAFQSSGGRGCDIGMFPNTVGFDGNGVYIDNIEGSPGVISLNVGRIQCIDGITIHDSETDAHTVIVNGANANQSVSIPDANGGADFILSEGDQLINGVKTFSSDLVIQPGGAGNTFTIASTNPAANRVYTVPDIAVDGSLTVEETTTLSSNYVDNGGGATYITGYSHQITRKNNQVTITFPTDSATFSGASTQVRTLSALDARFRPTSASQAFPARIQSVGVAQFGYVSVGTDGIITWYKDAAQTAWSGVANDRLFATSVTYNIA